jgi:carboxymethylproline synthase
MGFQFALMFDVKVAAASSKFIMPELKHGIGCSVGAAILNFTSGHNLMKNIVYNCEEISAERANTLHLVDHVVESDVLENFALEQARTLAAYPSVAFEKTKQSINKAFIHVMEAAKSESKRVHRASFGAKSAQKHFANILGNKY